MTWCTFFFYKNGIYGGEFGQTVAKSTATNTNSKSVQKQIDFFAL